MAKRKPPTDIGYGKPPAATQFKKGQSGNPKGRPKGSVGFSTLVQKLASERVTVQENGTRKRISKSEAAIKQLFNQASTGDQRSIKLVADLMNRQSAVPDATAPRFTLADADREVLTLLIARARHQDDGSSNA